MGEDFGAYCQRLRKPTEWGGHVEVQALARALGVNVVVHQPSEAANGEALLKSSIEVCNFDQNETRLVQLSFHSMFQVEHYNSVRRVDDDGQGVPPKLSVPEMR